MNKKLSILIMLLVVMVVPFKVNAVEEENDLVTTLAQTIKSSNSNLSSITLSSGTIDFNKNVKTYTIGVPFTVTKMTVNGVAEDAKATVSVTGKSTLEFGKNTYDITVKAEDATTSVYRVIVYKLHEGETIDNNYLSNLIITGQNINFDKNTLTYTVPIQTSDPLKLNVTLDDPLSTYQIFNNSNLEDGSQILVVVTARNGDKKAYKIITTMESDKNYPLLIGLISAGGVLAVVLVLLIHFQYRKKKRKKMLNNISKQNVINKDTSKATYDFNVNNAPLPTNNSTTNQEPVKTVVINSDIETSQKTNNSNNEEIL